MFQFGLLILAAVSMLGSAYLLMKTGDASSKAEKKKRTQVAIIPICFGFVLMMVGQASRDSFYEIVALCFAACFLALMLGLLNSTLKTIVNSEAN